MIFSGKVRQEQTKQKMRTWSVSIGEAHLEVVLPDMW